MCLRTKAVQQVLAQHVAPHLGARGLCIAIKDGGSGDGEIPAEAGCDHDSERVIIHLITAGCKFFAVLKIKLARSVR